VDPLDLHEGTQPSNIRTHCQPRYLSGENHGHLIAVVCGTDATDNLPQAAMWQFEEQFVLVQLRTIRAGGCRYPRLMVSHRWIYDMPVLADVEWDNIVHDLNAENRVLYHLDAVHHMYSAVVDREGVRCICRDVEMRLR
jgi:hypothetical protein